MAVFLNSFTPLSVNKFGKKSANLYNLPLYIDGSCRREPDFENSKPAITQLCRPKKLVTRLSKNDLVIYITKLGGYGTKQAHWKLISILEVIQVVPDHKSAYTFYTENNLPISQNIICEKTVPFPLDYTHGQSEHNNSNTDPIRVIEKWNAGYRFRAKQYPQVAITQIWNGILYLDNPPIIDHEMMKSIFGRIPGTQNPPKLRDIEWQNFKTEMNL
jgi:hypothetical protein